MHVLSWRSFQASSEIVVSVTFLSNLTLITQNVTADLYRFTFMIVRYRVIAQTFNKIVQENLSGRTVYILSRRNDTGIDIAIFEEYSPNTLEGLINARWYQSFAMKVKRENDANTNVAKERRPSSASVAAELPESSFFFRKLILSLEIKICAHWKRKREIFTLPASEKLAVLRPPIFLLITEVGYSVVITENFVKLSFKENLTFPELFSGALMARFIPTIRGCPY